MPTLSVWSLNANSLQSQQKRRAIFKKCRDGAYDFCLLQETHSTQLTEGIWKAEWGGNIIFSHGESNARGVAILIPRDSNFVVNQEVRNNNGRLLIIKASRDEQCVVLGNIYAPTQDHPQEQSELINLIKDELIDIEATDIVLGGDFNICMSEELDRSKGRAQNMSIRSTAYKDRIQAFMDSLHLVDVWRTLHPTSKRFSFRRGGYASRLDLWVASEHLLNSNTRSDINTEPLSDHAAISLKIGLEDVHRGPGLWRFCNTLLEDEALIEILHDTIDQEKNSSDGLDPRSKWDWIKHRIKEETIKITWILMISKQ